MNLPSEVDKAIWVHVVKNPDGRVVIRGTWLETAAGVTGRWLDHVPLGRIEAVLNTPSVQERVEARLTDDWETPSTGMRSLLDIARPRHDLKVEEPRVRLKFRIPTERRRPDSFYLQVAETYSRQAALSNRPAADIARANDVPPTTVTRWLKEARRRGLLAPTRRGMSKPES